MRDTNVLYVLYVLKLLTAHMGYSASAYPALLIKARFNFRLTNQAVNEK